MSISSVLQKYDLPIFTLGQSRNKELGTDPEQRLYLACHHSSRPVDSGLCFDSLHISILLALAPLTLLLVDTWSTHALLGEVKNAKKVVIILFAERYYFLIVREILNLQSCNVISI